MATIFLSFNKDLFIFTLCMIILPACISVHLVYAQSMEGRRHKILWNVITEDC